MIKITRMRRQIIQIVSVYFFIGYPLSLVATSTLAYFL